MTSKFKVGDKVKFYPTKRDRELEPLMGHIFAVDNHNTYCPYKWKVRQFVGRQGTKSRVGPNYHLQNKQIEKVTDGEFFLWNLANAC